VYDVLNEKTAPAIWEKVNALLAKEEFRALGMIQKSKVEVICTTDDPTDTLEYHILIRDNNEFKVKVLPTFRPDKAVNIEKSDFTLWVEKLSSVSGRKINNFTDFLAALEDRARFFDTAGCRVSDHGLDYMPYRESSVEEASNIFDKALKGEQLSLEEIEKYKTVTLKFFGVTYAKLGWAMQLHMNVIRNTNARMFKVIGPDTGFDSINDYPVANQLSRFLDSLDAENLLPKTILYTLNPKDNYVLATTMGCFQGGGVKGKIQFGSAWWFIDNKEGMMEQMKTLANVGLLSCFVGMLTDSRSFLSYTRHEYFRRILCNLLGEWIENGEIPDDMEHIGSIVKDICYYNSKEYFGF
jgi:glucuronate isomerase